VLTWWVPQKGPPEVSARALPARLTRRIVYSHEGAPASHKPFPVAWPVFDPLSTLGTLAIGVHVASAREPAPGAVAATIAPIAQTTVAPTSAGIDQSRDFERAVATPSEASRSSPLCQIL
jgi:hypothetical protein